MNASDATNAILGVILKSQNMQLSILTALTATLPMSAELREQTEKAVKDCIAVNNQTIDIILNALDLNADSDCKPE